MTRTALLLIALAVPLGESLLAATIDGRILPAELAARSNFVVSIEDAAGAPPVSKTIALMDQKELRFVPHVLAIQAGTTVEFPNSDPVSHNVFSISSAKRFNLGLYVRGAKRQITFDQPGVVELLCNVHMEMSGFIVVLNTPYFNHAGPDGAYRITGVPAGRHLIRCWNETLPTQERTVEVPPKGSVTVDFSMSPQHR